MCAAFVSCEGEFSSFFILQAAPLLTCNLHQKPAKAVIQLGGVNLSGGLPTW